MLRKSDVETGGHEFYSLNHGFRSFQRTALIDFLLQKSTAAACTLHVNKRLESYSVRQDSTLALHFDDNSIHEADVLIGADGIHSRIRSIMFKHNTEPRFSGQFAYRMLCSSTALRSKYPNHEALRGFKIVSDKASASSKYLSLTSIVVRQRETCHFASGGRIHICDCIRNRPHHPR